MNEVNETRSGSPVDSGCSAGTDPAAVAQGVQWVQALQGVRDKIDELSKREIWHDRFTEGVKCGLALCLIEIDAALEKAHAAASHGGEAIPRTH